MDFGLTEDEFWCLTPRQHYSLRKRKRNETEHRELLNGIVAATIANNAPFGGKREAKTAEDFMPCKWRPDVETGKPVPKKKKSKPKDANKKKRWTDKDRMKLATQISTMFKVMAAAETPLVRIVYDPNDPNNPANKNKETTENGRENQVGHECVGSRGTEGAVEEDNSVVGQ